VGSNAQAIANALFDGWHDDLVFFEGKRKRLDPDDDDYQE